MILKFETMSFILSVELCTFVSFYCDVFPRFFCPNLTPGTSFEPNCNPPSLDVCDIRHHGILIATKLLGFASDNHKCNGIFIDPSVLV